MPKHNRTQTEKELREDDKRDQINRVIDHLQIEDQLLRRLSKSYNITYDKMLEIIDSYEKRGEILHE